nr:MAG TPA: Thioredoxin [Caudoviricetes sp.]
MQYFKIVVDFLCKVCYTNTRPESGLGGYPL